MCETVVYILGLYHNFGELDIYGVYTDKKKLYEMYQMLLREDYICQEEETFGQSNKPLIFQRPFNTSFIGEKMEWGYSDFVYFDDLEKEKSGLRIFLRVFLMGFRLKDLKSWELG